MSALFGFVQTLNLKTNFSEYQIIKKTLLAKNLRMKKLMIMKRVSQFTFNVIHSLRLFAGNIYYPFTKISFNRRRIF